MKLEITILRLNILFRLLYLDKTKYLFRPVSLWIGWKMDKRIYSYLKLIDIVISGHSLIEKLSNKPCVHIFKKTVTQR